MTQKGLIIKPPAARGRRRRHSRNLGQILLAIAVVRLSVIENLTHLFEVLVHVLVLDPLVLSVKVNHFGSVEEDRLKMAEREVKQ